MISEQTKQREGTARAAVINDLIKAYPVDTKLIHDGYHSIGDLYEYRKVYNALLFNEWARYREEVETGIGMMQINTPKYDVHKSMRHSDGELCFGGGWFIVVAQLPTGQVSNHYKEEDWDLFRVPVVYTAAVWDGHTPQQALDRMKAFIQQTQ